MKHAGRERREGFRGKIGGGEKKKKRTGKGYLSQGADLPN